MDLAAELPRIITQAKRVVVLTGAGVSAESGIPTFRGPEGLWKTYRAEDLATPEAFEKDPRLVWEWYDWRRRKVNTCAPNPAHYAIAQMEVFYPEFYLFTQNVDGLHRKAGSQKVTELHGNIWKMRCVKEGRVIDDYRVPLEPIPPLCSCGNLLRPHIVWFGENLDEEDLNMALGLSRQCEFFLTVGTSGVVQPAASLPVLAKRAGAFVVEVNPEYTPLSPHMDLTLLGKAGEILPELLKLLK
jgi:NAD-dependent deacetylase